MRNRARYSARLLCGTAMAVVTMTAAPAFAEGKAINIEPQSLATALREFASQSQQAILVSPALADNKTSQGVHDTADPELALAQLLQGTGLTWRRSGEALLIVSASDPQSGSAAGDGADAGTVQALIVTAQKREEDIQDVPIAISAFTQEDLTRSQVAGGPDLVTQVPNFTFTKTNFSSYSIQIRGIGTQAISATTDPAVAVAFNNTPFIRNRFFEQEFYDLERVEVLRGPQGTLYGRNATAGVVNIISAKPKFRYEARLSGDVGNFSSSRLEGMINIPLVEDKVALRVAGAWTKRDGYATNELTGNPIDGRDLWSTRVSLRMQPNDRLNINLLWEHFQEDDGRLRSGKQLCKKDVVTNVGGVPITNYLDTSVSGGQSTTLYSGVQAALSQGCKRNSLYDQSSFQRPNGLMLPYYVPLGAVGLPTALIDPYVMDFPILPGGPHGFIDTTLVDATNDQPQDLRVIQSTVDPKYRARDDIGELQVSFDLGAGLTLTSETAYGTDRVYSLEDFNRFNTAPGAWDTTHNAGLGLIARGVLTPDGYFCDPQLGCSNRLVAVDISTASARQFSQEFRLASDYDGPFNFSLGANFLRGDSEDKYYVFINSLSLSAIGGAPFSGFGTYYPGITDNTDCLLNGYSNGNPNSVYPVVACTYVDPNPISSVNDQGHNYFLSKNPYKLISYAVFGEAYYQITDNLKLTAGLRWTVDKKEAPRIPTWVLNALTVGYPVAETIRQEWREPTGRLTLDWKPDLSFTDQTLVYASLAHGYKAGGANPPGFVRAFYSDRSVAEVSSARSATRPRIFDPEFLNAIELGTKNTLDDGKLTLNLASFYYDYTGYQVSEIVDRSAYNRNFDATVWGAELEAEWRPLENLRLGFKGGYEKTRIADGMQAIDLMDRTAGNPDWLVVRPFPTYASSCIIPTYVFVSNGTLGPVGQVGGGGPSACELAYSMNLDPLTWLPYVPNPTVSAYFVGLPAGYPGFDPSTAPNGGEGIAKQLGGNELPNAPHWTATVTGDYTVPLADDWLLTLHSDVHWQSQSWWRVFNDSTFDKLHPYFTMNLAAIFANEERGWNVMAYIKNVTDETAITGAFLNSDDTGLTTNVFLTEPRLYGLRVTKAWTGSSSGWLSTGEASPFTVEVGGQVQRHDAPNQALHPAAADFFPAPFNIFDSAQAQKLDWGDGGEAKVTYAPESAQWSVGAAVKYGKTNGFAHPSFQQSTTPVCVFGSQNASLCARYAAMPGYGFLASFSKINRADAAVYTKDENLSFDLTVGHVAPLAGLQDSKVSLSLRYADLKTKENADLYGIPDWNIPDGFLLIPGFLSVHNIYNINANARRSFEGYGPVLGWDAGAPLISLPGGGDFGLSWSLESGVLFGQQKAEIASTTEVRNYQMAAYPLAAADLLSVQPKPTSTTVTSPPAIERSNSATVPVLGAALGLSYKAGGFTMGAGYRWERYFNAIDGGFEAHKSYDRTIDGPYFKIAVGFGG